MHQIQITHNHNLCSLIAKGVVITHRSTIAGAAAAEPVLALKATDEYLAYLPLAHIMELMVEFVIIANGCKLNYADPKSLTATGSYPTGALEVYGPTHMVAVPKIWDTSKCKQSLKCTGTFRLLF